MITYHNNNIQGSDLATVFFQAAPAPQNNILELEVSYNYSDYFKTKTLLLSLKDRILELIQV